MSSDMAVRVQELSKAYRLYDRQRDRFLQPFLRRRRLYTEVRALDGISFEVGRGETVGIVGRNGSGKSTLLQVIAGTLAPSGGSVEVNGRVVALLELGSGFDPEFTGRENVFMNGAILGMDRAEMARRFDDIAAFADIGAYIDQPVKTYSSGMLVRLAFAVSVHVDPEVLIVDEALAVGDAAFQFKCIERMEQVTRSGTTLLLVSHDMTLIKTYCDRVIYLRHGRERVSGPPEDVVEQYLMDTREDQMRALAAAPVVCKPALGSAQELAFGTELGRVVRAEFSDTGRSQSAYLTGQQARVRVEVEYSASVADPCLIMLVQNHKRVKLGGQCVQIQAKPDPDGVCRATLVGSFRVRLGGGRYFITLRLEDHGAGGASLPIDKQPGALVFDVAQRDKDDFLGMVDFDMHIEGDAPGADVRYEPQPRTGASAG